MTTTTRITPNGSTLVEDGPFLLHGFRVSRTVRTHPHPNLADHESVTVITLDGKRTVAFWARFPRHTSALVCHYRDRGDDCLNGAELDEVLAFARDRWPRR